MTRTIRRAGISLAAAATLTVSSLGIASADTVTDDPVEAAAGWLVTQLTDGDHVVVEFDGDEFLDQGLTADIVYALAAAGVGATTIEDATAWLATQSSVYVGPGASAKLLLAADVAGQDVRDVGGVDLIEAIGSLEADSGLYEAEWNSTLNQALAVLALARADDASPSEEAIAFLLAQRCDDGGFRGEVEGDTCDSHLDTTSFVVQALLAVGDADAAGDAVAWLAGQQGDDGSFAGDAGPNSNATGLAALALALGGATGEADAARAWLLDQQAGCDTETPGAILADPEGVGDTLRATPQAILGLVGEGLVTLDAGGAGTDVPQLRCDEVADEPANDAADDPQPDADDDAPEAVDDADDAPVDADDDEPSAAPAADTADDGAPVALIAVVVLVVVGGAVLLLVRRRSTTA